MPTALGNAFMKAVILSPLHGFLGNGFAVITVTGRKTGRRISTPINISPTNGGFTVISYRNRTWWRNLEVGRAGELHHRGSKFSVDARILKEKSGVAAELKTYFERYPAQAKYFGIRMDADERVFEEDLTREAQERVVILLSPSASG